MSAPLLRLGVVGATGTVGGEVLALLEARRFPLQELVPVATDRSLGEHVELLGHEIPVTTEPPSLRGLDLVVLCTPPAASLDWVRRALQVEVPVIDLSGALASRAEVPLPGEEAGEAEVATAPLLAVAAGRVLAWARVLRALGTAARPTRVRVAALDAAAAAGQAGIDALEAETLGVFQQQDVEPSEVFGHPVAFECIAPRSAGEGGDDRRAEAELPRLRPGLPVEVATVRVPAFSGSGATLFVDLAEEVDPGKLASALDAAEGVVRVPADEDGPGTRAASGSEEVVVGALRVRAGPAPSLSLFAAADPVHLAAAHALRLAERRFGRG